MEHGSPSACRGERAGLAIGEAGKGADIIGVYQRKKNQVSLDGFRTAFGT